MKKHFVALSFMTALALMSCNEGDTTMNAETGSVTSSLSSSSSAIVAAQSSSSVSNQTTTSSSSSLVINNPETKTLQANYTAFLSDAQIKADLQILAASNLGAGMMFMDVDDSTSDPLIDIPLFGGIEASGQSIALARRAMVAEAECFSMDTTETLVEEGITTVMAMRWYASDSSLLSICADYESVSTEEEANALMSQMYKQMDGSFLAITTTMAGDELTGNMEMSASMDLDWDAQTLELDPIAMQISLETSILMLQPDTFSVYAVGQFSMDLDMASDEDNEEEEDVAPENVTGSVILHLMDGRYRITLDMAELSQMEDSTSQKMKLFHDDQPVGTLTIDEEGNTVVTDALDNVVKP